jgi:hypothetical protein
MLNVTPSCVTVPPDVPTVWPPPAAAAGSPAATGEARAAASSLSACRASIDRHAVRPGTNREQHNIAPNNRPRRLN